MATLKTASKKLPRPDYWGNYWFGEPGKADTNAILTVCNNHNKHFGKWYIQVNGEIIFEGKELKCFISPDLAYQELLKRSTNGK